MREKRDPKFRVQTSQALELRTSNPLLSRWSRLCRLLSCGASPDHQILNPFNPHHRHDDAHAFFIMRKIIDKRLVGDELTHHGNLNANFSPDLELPAEDITGPGIRNHDEITRDFFRFESDNT